MRASRDGFDEARDACGLLCTAGYLHLFINVYNFEGWVTVQDHINLRLHGWLAPLHAATPSNSLRLLRLISTRQYRFVNLKTPWYEATRGIGTSQWCLEATVDRIYWMRLSNQCVIHRHQILNSLRPRYPGTRAIIGILDAI